MSDVELALRLTADASDATDALDSVGDSATRMASEVDAAAAKTDAAGAQMGSMADSADNLGSSTSQAAGGLGDLGGALSAVPGPLGAVGTGMETLAPLVMGVTGATDLLTLATNSKIVTTIKDKAAMVGHAVATTASSAASKAAAAAQWLLNAALTANPIGAVILLVVALVAGFVLAYKKSETFREIVDTAMGAAKKAIGTVVDVIKDIKTFIGDVVDKVPNMSGVFSVASTLIKGYIEIWLTPLKLVKEAIEWVIDHLSKIKLPDLSALPGVPKTVAGRSDALSRVPTTDGSAPAAAVIYAPVIVNGYVGNEAQLARIIAPALEAAIRRVNGPRS